MNLNPSFPTPPITMLVLQGLIDTYQTKLADALKGGHFDTIDKTAAKKALQNALRVLGKYVSQVALAGITTPSANPTEYTIAQGVILSSGFNAFINPSKPVQNGPGLTIPIIRSVTSTGGVIKILLKQYAAPKKGKVFFQVQYRTSEIPASGSTPVVPAGPWQTSTFTAQNNIHFIPGFDGQFMDYQIAAVGGHNTKLNTINPLNLTPIRKIAIK